MRAFSRRRAGPIRREEVHRCVHRGAAEQQGAECRPGPPGHTPGHLVQAGTKQRRTGIDPGRLVCAQPEALVHQKGIAGKEEESPALQPGRHVDADPALDPLPDGFVRRIEEPAG